jgi:hypothetical protein
MQLINTIEISPYDFSDKEYDSPNVSKLEFSDEWYKYWKKCISDKKLGRLEPIEKGQAKLKEIRKEQNEFEYRIRKILDKMGIANAERISKLLTGND